MKPFLSIIIPCFNHGQYLEETISSVVTNSNKYDYEIIVINDGSTDLFTIETFKNLESKFKNLKIIHQENQGLAKARNNGIKISEGKYILPLDSDNNVTSSYLNKAIDILEQNTHIDIVYGDAKYIGEKNGIWKNKPIDKKRILFGNHIDACAIFRKTTWEDVDGYSEDMPYMGNEDWNFWIKSLSKGKCFYYLEEICFEYRVLTTSMSRNVPFDYKEKIFAFNTYQLYDFYLTSFKEDCDLFHNIFHGNIFKKVGKLILNHFKLYRY